MQNANENQWDDLEDIEQFDIIATECEMSLGSR
jgi:hypothetical protein